MRTNALLFLVCGVMSSHCFAEPTLKGFPLTFMGLGPIHIGMSESQFNKLGFKFSENPSGYDECVEVTLAANNKIDVMFENNKITRLSAYDSSVKTQAGSMVGATENDIKKAYGLRLKVNPHKYDENGHYLVVKSSSGKYAIVYETDGVKVTAIHAGLESSAQYVEGCL